MRTIKIATIPASTSFPGLVKEAGYKKPKGFASKCEVPGMKEIMVIGVRDAITGDGFAMASIGNGMYEIHYWTMEG